VLYTKYIILVFSTPTHKITKQNIMTIKHMSIQLLKLFLIQDEGLMSVYLLEEHYKGDTF